MIRRATLLALLALTTATPARADDVAEAKAHFNKGVEYFHDHRWREAVAEFEAAYRLKPHGSIHFNVAQCRERLEDWPGALRAYQDYLREMPGATDRAAVRATMRVLEGRLAAAGVQLLVVYTDPPGARLAIDGKDRGRTPFHVVLTPGSYHLALALEGFVPVKEQVEISGASSRVLDLALKAVPPVPSAGAATAPDLKARPRASAPVAPAPPAPRKGKLRRYLPAMIAAGAAVAAAAAGVYLGSSAKNDAEAIDRLSAPDQARASSLASDARSKARAANVLYAIAGGAAAVGGTLFVIEARF